MTDHPLPFTAPMIRALLAGNKTQTRRIIKPQPEQTCADPVRLTLFRKNGKPIANASIELIPGVGRPILEYWPVKIGDRFWVREAWRTFVSLDGVRPRDLWSPGCGKGAGILYEADQGGMALTADGDRTYGDRDNPEAFGKLRPPMFMPRWASRITLTVEDIKIERLQSIGHMDAVAEGIIELGRKAWIGNGPLYGLHEGEGHDTATGAYNRLWRDINGDDSWAKNPWVVAYGFSVSKPSVPERGEC